jgi:hypothetical protein
MINSDKDKISKEKNGVGQYATAISLVAALFVGFLQLPGALLLILTALAMHGVRYYYPANFQSPLSYVSNFILIFCLLSVCEWGARIASLYMTGRQFLGHVE